VKLKLPTIPPTKEYNQNSLLCIFESNKGP